MRKFWEFYRINLTERFSSQTEGLVWFLTETIPILAMTSLWKSLEYSGQVTPDRASEMILYFVISLFITRSVSTYFDEWLINEIKDGHFSTYLLKPISLKFYLIAHQFASRTQGTIYIIPVFILLAKLYIPALLSVVSVQKLLIFGIILVITFAQKFMFSWIISMAAFWIDQASALNHVKWVMEGVFGGAWLPMSFFPVWWESFAKLTPFYSWYYFPIKILISQNVTTPELLWGLGSSVAWLITLIIFGEYFWRKSIRHYSATGS